MITKTYTISDLIVDLQEIEKKHGNINVYDGRGNNITGRQVEVVDVDDWDHTTKTDDGEIPGVAHALEIGRRY